LLQHGHIIATEELPQDLARSLIPKARTLSDTKRVLCYYRMSPGPMVIPGALPRRAAAEFIEACRLTAEKVERDQHAFNSSEEPESDT
jgi:hypothetical protein